MHRTGIWLAMWVVVGAVGGTGSSGGSGTADGLDQLAARLDLTDRGIDWWLTRFVSDVDGDQAERLFVLSASGEPLAERAGDSSSVELDGELDRLLRQPGMDVVLVHNHPASRGLSAADVGQIAKQGVTAVVAIGRDGSVFVASAGRGMNRDRLQVQAVCRRPARGEAAASHRMAVGQSVCRRQRCAHQPSRVERAGRGRRDSVLVEAAWWEPRVVRARTGRLQ